MEKGFEAERVNDICPKLENCPIFKKFSADTTSQFFIKMFCEKSYNNCARKQIADKGQKVPDNLMPDGSVL